MKYVSLFAGIGGFDLALNRLGHECVYANEWDKYSAQTYEKNFGHKPDTRSITSVPLSDIPNHDLLVGGFPCQAFSIAGKRKGFQDTRGTLFFEIARILNAKRPAYLFLENVKGLLSHDNNRTFQTILRTLDELGYELQWQVLNSKNFGVPQNRERVFIIGHLRGRCRPEVFPIRSTNEICNGQNKTSKEMDNIASTLTARQFASWNGNYVRENPVAPTLRATDYKRGDNQTVVLQHSRDEKGTTSYNERDIAGTLKQPSGNTQNYLKENMTVRRLTPIECERLQGFPDNWTQGVSDTQRYKQLGNAVSVPVVYEIAKRL